ncbi:DUF4259 domain-containing protein [Streptomyces sp. NPDC096013]|uniref:DUF4259 domain-containing protein n=1 Tax=Streptomyces sp. NPDC096013 TaxID=3366069 RepID=UPI00381F7A2B
MAPTRPRSAPHTRRRPATRCGTGRRSGGLHERAALACPQAATAATPESREYALSTWLPPHRRPFAGQLSVAAQHPDGEPTCSNYGPSEPLPELSADLRTLAVHALDQVASERSELAGLWVEAANGSKWRHDIARPTCRAQ